MSIEGARRERKRERTRREILAAAEALAGEQDFGRTSVDAICARADVARATFFLHFRGKPALLGALESGLADELDDALEGVRPRAAAVLRAIADALWRRAGVVCWVVGAGPSDGPLLARTRTVLEALATAGELRRGTRPELLARLLLAGAASTLALSPGQPDPALRDELLGVLLSGAAETKPRVKWAPPADG